MSTGARARRYHRPLPMLLRRILLCLLALALLNASPGLHWHEHSHEALHVAELATAQAPGEEPEDDEDAHGLCVECLLQAQTAATPPSPGCALPATAPQRFPAAAACQPFAQAPPGGAVRARGPPHLTA